MSTVSRKRRGDDLSSSRPNKADRFQKKRKRQQPAYHSDSESMDDDEEKLGDVEADEDDEFQAVDLLDSDDEALDALADDGATSDEDNDEAGSSDDDGDDLDSLSDDAPKTKTPKKTKQTKPVAAARDAPTDESDDGESDAESDSEDAAEGRPKSKRNDPATFATSLSKILGTKLSSTRRADPVLARSAEAHEASRRVVDAQLEEKARRQMRLEKRAALEKGRVKDVLIATNREVASGDDSVAAETTTTILATERRLRKVAQRGVVQLFNAVRVAQTKAAQAQKQVKSEGLLGMDKREARVTEMSRKGFLDLIASGGGGLKKGGLEEA
ncbi:pre-60S ribosomal particles component [Sporothrix eucalyptigena]|uniref:Pre-60S ribosomal particles component n=1 Tax=Sporothrix eucalyptigena TaxID=1812306 RepID=A0ABP0B2T4_9PEZI